MRHNKKNNHLSRQTQHRSLMFSNMASSLILNKRIVTTLAKAKALKMFFEPIVTRAKEDSQHSRRICFSLLRNKYAVTELFDIVAPKVANRPGGYTRIIKTSTRLGDSAQLCILEMVDFNTLVETAEVVASPAKTRRSRKKTRRSK